jgi:hypothetical protein
MSKGRHTEAEMIGALKQLEAGRTAADIGPYPLYFDIQDYENNRSNRVKCNVHKEHRELPVQLPPEHHAGDHRLQNQAENPDHVMTYG